MSLMDKLTSDQVLDISDKVKQALKQLDKRQQERFRKDFSEVITEKHLVFVFDKYEKLGTEFLSIKDYLNSGASYKEIRDFVLLGIGMYWFNFNYLWCRKALINI